MQLLRYKFPLIIVILVEFSHCACYAQELSSCKDTQFGSDSASSVLRSRYHLFQIFGDISYRQTNFFDKDYSGAVMWSENRFFFARFSEFVETSIPLPDPYLIGILKGLRDIDWEDRWDYGLGIEWRPLRNTSFLEQSFFSWTHHLRCYVSYFKSTYLQYQDEWAWRPSDELRIGIELYRECNVYDDQKYWTEIWADCSWRETNFYIDEFKNWTFGFAPKWGIKLLSDRERAIMPYFMADITIIEHREFWQNRALLGLGIRVMPFRWHSGLSAVFMRGTRIYIEGIKVVDYFKDKAIERVPSYDFRAGVNYTIVKW